MTKTTICLAVATSLALPGCASIEQSRRAVVETFASNDPCSNNVRNIAVTTGALGGAVLGALIAKQTGQSGDGALIAAAAGAAVGGGVGWKIGQDVDVRRCEMYKIAQRYHIFLKSSPIQVNGQKDPIGLSVTLPEQAGGGHFSPGSDVLTPAARRYFAEIARQYSLSVQLAGLRPAAAENERNALRKQLSGKKLVLIGHTDDTGDSVLNAELSEQRARAVAQLFRENGVFEQNIYYQGAGETLPIADNRMAEGRSLNRRVEIIDVNNEAALRAYLDARAPNLDYYRPVEAPMVAAAASGAAKPAEKTAALPSSAASTRTQSKIQAKPAGDSHISHQPSIAAVPAPSAASASPQTTTSKPVRNTTVASTALAGAPVGKTPVQSRHERIDFGGVPFNNGNAILDIGGLLQDEGGFPFIAKAQAAGPNLLTSCLRDRPRAAGEVKSLRSGKVYTTNEHLAGLYNTTWVDQVNGHLIVLNKVAVLREGAVPAHPPEFKVYLDYNAQLNRNAKPDLQLAPVVNTYRGHKGVLYRLFTRDAEGIQCLDVLFPLQGGVAARAGKLAYRGQGGMYIANFNPKKL